MTTKVALQDKLAPLLNVLVGSSSSSESGQPIVAANQQQQPPVYFPHSSSNPSCSSSSSSSTAVLVSAAALNSLTLSLASSFEDAKKRDDKLDTSRATLEPPSASSSPSPSNSCTEVINGSPSSPKRRKMGKGSDPLNDSGIPMDGIELDSSSTEATLSTSTDVTRGIASIDSHPQLGTTNSSPVISSAGNPLSAISREQTSNNEAVASESVSMCDGIKLTNRNSNQIDEHCTDFVAQASNGETRPFGTSNPDVTMEDNTPLHEQGNEVARSQNQSQNCHQPNGLRTFGDLFDDDDLD